MRPKCKNCDSGWSIWLWFCTINSSSTGRKPDCTWISAGTVYDGSQITCSKVLSLCRFTGLNHSWITGLSGADGLMPRGSADSRLQNLGVPNTTKAPLNVQSPAFPCRGSKGFPALLQGQLQLNFVGRRGTECVIFWDAHWNHPLTSPHQLLSSLSLHIRLYLGGGMKDWKVWLKRWLDTLTKPGGFLQ